MWRLSIPNFSSINHQPSFASDKQPEQDWTNKPHVTNNARIMVGHFVSVFFSTFLAIGGSLLFGAAFGDVSVNPSPDGVGRNMALLAFLHVVLLYYVFNTSALSILDIRVNPYITLADFVLHRAIGGAACVVELLAQGVGGVAGTAFAYALVVNTPVLKDGVGGTIVNTSVGWAFALAILAGIVLGWSYFHNYGMQSGRYASQMAIAIGVMVGLSFPYLGPTTHNPLRWLGACVAEGTCGASGSWIYATGPAIGIVVGYGLHLVTETWSGKGAAVMGNAL